MRYFFLLVSIFCIINCFAQYKIDKTIFEYPKYFSSSETPGNYISYKGVGEYIYILFHKDNVVNLSKFNIHTNEYSEILEDNHFPKEVSIKDFVCNNDKIFIVSNDRCHYYSITTKVGYPKELKTKEKLTFNRVMILDDSSVLLYTCYNYHPGDNQAGLYLNIVNSKRCVLLRSKFFEIPGIALSHMSVNWIGVIDKRIYLATPLSNKLIFIDNKLKITDTIPIQLFNDVVTESNISFETTIDSITKKEFKRLRKIFDTVPLDTIVKHQNTYMSSEIYSKEFISSLSKNVRDKYPFIEKVFTIDDSSIALSISHPTYKYKYRNLVVFNISSKKIDTVYSKWLCGVRDTISTKEDFYSVDLINDNRLAPYFLNRHKVLFASYYPIDIFLKGSFDNMNKMMYEYVLKNGYKWTLVSYDY